MKSAAGHQVPRVVSNGAQAKLGDKSAGPGVTQAPGSASGLVRPRCFLPLCGLVSPLGAPPKKNSGLDGEKRKRSSLMLHLIP